MIVVGGKNEGERLLHASSDWPRAIRPRYCGPGERGQTTCRGRESCQLACCASCCISPSRERNLRVSLETEMAPSACRPKSLEESMPSRWKRLFLFPILTGLAGGAAAAAMEWGLHYGTEALIGKVVPADAFATLQFHWAILILPAIGGLLCGLIVPRLCRGAKQQGTDTVIRAFHRNNGEQSARTGGKAIAAVGVD